MDNITSSSRPVTGKSLAMWETRLFPVTGLLAWALLQDITARWAIRCYRAEWHSGWVRFHVPVTCEYTNGWIWACNRYRCGHTVHVWPTQYWADTTCNPPALNKCGGATSPKTPHELVMKSLDFGHLDLIMSIKLTIALLSCWFCTRVLIRKFWTQQK
jgi:hypothetical protein